MGKTRCEKRSVSGHNIVNGSDGGNVGVRGNARELGNGITGPGGGRAWWRAVKIAIGAAAKHPTRRTCACSYQEIEVSRRDRHRL